MSLLKTFKPTKTKIFFFLGLFFLCGVLKIFVLENFLTHEIYKMSLFEQYQFQFMHQNDVWYQKGDKVFWVQILFLHLVAAYVVVCVLAFIINRLRGKDC